MAENGMWYRTTHNGCICSRIATQNTGYMYGSWHNTTDIRLYYCTRDIRAGIAIDSEACINPNPVIVVLQENPITPV